MTAFKAVSDPSRPWMKNPEWAAGRIVDRRQIGTPVMLLAALVIGLPAAAFLVWIVAEVIGGTTRNLGELAGAALFCVVLVGVFGIIFVMWRRYRKFGPSECHLETIPGVLGGEFKAKVHAPWSTRPSGDVTIKLRNLRSAGKSVSTIWEATSTVPPVALEQLGITRFAIPCRFQIPGDVARPTGSGVWWSLEVQAPMPGLDYRASFNVPVFDVAETAARSDREVDAVTMFVAGVVSSIGAIAVGAAALRLFSKSSMPEFLSFLAQLDDAAAWGLFAVGIILSLSVVAVARFRVARNQNLRAKSTRPQ